jgi:hypothetical protein
MYHMILIDILILLLLFSCSTLPQIAKDIDDIATDTAIKVQIEISKEAMRKDNTVHVIVDSK